jgi:neutral ceramidase
MNTIKRCFQIASVNSKNKPRSNSERVGFRGGSTVGGREKLFHLQFVLSAWLLLAACGGVQVPAVNLKPPQIVEHKATNLSVGTARADITVPPGAATFGHAIDSRVAGGYWTRLYCRVFYFETSHGQKLALIPCEMAAMSVLLQRSVAEQVKDFLHPSQIMMTAIHTHAGMAHYFETKQYSAHLSTRFPAHDPEMVRFLSTRISDAIKRAKKAARPAKVSWMHRDDFWCFTRNRSLDAYKQNHPLYVHSVPNPLPCTELKREDYRAIDPTMHVLRIDARDPNNPDKSLGPIGSISFFAIHPTVIHNTNKLFGGDLLGIVNRYVERQLRRQLQEQYPYLKDCAIGCDHPDCPKHLPDPLHGVINTNQGDISPMWTRGDIDEAIFLGTQLADFVWKSHPTQEQGKPEAILDLRYVEEDIRGASFHDRKNKRLETCDSAVLGQGAARGASDHRTSLAPIPMFETDPPVDYSDPEYCHAPKRSMLGGIGSFLTSSEGSFPSHLPLAVARIDDTMLSFVPGEMTITAGNRLNQRILDRISKHANAPRYAVVAGLANSYIQYIATKEEYQLQYYEGASTLYGPDSAEYFANRMAYLARSMFESDVEIPGLGQAREIDTPDVPEGERLAQADNDEIDRKPIKTCRMPGYLQPPRVCMVWFDRGPGDVALIGDSQGKGDKSRSDNNVHSPFWIQLVQDTVNHPPVRLCYSTDDTVACDYAGFVDDRQEEFQTRIHARVKDAWVWSTLFSPSKRTWRQLNGQTVRIRVDSKKSETEVASEPFSSNKLPSTCTPKETRLCLDGQRTEEWDELLK